MPNCLYQWKLQGGRQDDESFICLSVHIQYSLCILGCRFNVYYLGGRLLVEKKPCFLYQTE